MPPRIDPYANKTHRRIDIALILITLALIFFALRLSANERATGANTSARSSLSTH